MGWKLIAFCYVVVAVLVGCGGGSGQPVKDSLQPQPQQSTYAIYVSTISNSPFDLSSTIHRFTFDPASSALREVDASVVVPVTLTMLTIRRQHDFLLGGGGPTQKIWPLTPSGSLSPETDSLDGRGPIISTANGRYLLDVQSDYGLNAIERVIQVFSLSGAGKLQDSGQRMVVDPAPPGNEHDGARRLTLLGLNSASDGDRLWVDVYDLYRGYANSFLLSVRLDPETGALDAPVWNSGLDHIFPTRFAFAGNRILASDFLGVHLFGEDGGRLTQISTCCQNGSSLVSPPIASHPDGILAFAGMTTDGTISTVAVSDRSLTPLQTTSCCNPATCCDDDLSALSVTPDGQYLLVGRSRGLKIFQVDAETGRLAPVAEASLPERSFSILAFQLSQ